MYMPQGIREECVNARHTDMTEWISKETDPQHQ